MLFSLRRAAAVSTIALCDLLGLTGAASAASVSSSGTVLALTGDAGSDLIHVAQHSAIHLEFDAGAAPLTESSPSCARVVVL